MNKKISYGKKLAFILGALLILMAVFSACSGENSDRISEIRSVKYNKESGAISITATLDSADVREFRGETIYLMEVPPNCTAADIVTLIPVAKAKSASEMSFSVPLRDGARTSLYSGFVLAAFDHANGYIGLSDIKYIESPKALSKNNSPYPSYSSIKGLSVVSSSDAVMLGVKHTVIRVPIEEYILPDGGERTITSIFDGVSHYYNADKVNELDYKIKTLSGSGIEVFLEFTLDTPPSSLPSTLSCLSSFSGAGETNEASHYAINVMSGDSYRHMAALFEFFADRYTREDGKYGFAASYIIGNGVNFLTENNFDNDRTLSDAVSRYSRLLRLAHTALCSKYAEGRVFVSINNRWNIEKEDESIENGEEHDPALPISFRNEFGGAEYLTALQMEISDGGSFEYGIALMPDPSDGSSMVWSDINSKNSADTEFLTVKNLSVIRDHIGESQELMIYNYGISSVDEASMAASYAYAYLMAEKADVCAFVYNGHFDGATGNGETGLYAVGEDGTAERRREIYEVFKNIDVVGAPEPESAKLRIGAEWSELWKDMKGDVKSFCLSEKNGSTSKNEKDKKLKKAEDKMLFDFSDGRSYDFYPSDSASYVEISEYIGQRVLKCGLLPKYKGEKMGVRSAAIPYEMLDGVLQIEAVLCADGGEGNTTLVSLALLQNGKEKSVLHMSHATVQSSNRQKVYFDMRDAKISKDNGDITMFIWVESSAARSPYYSGEEYEELELYVESLSASIYKSNSKAIIISVVVSLAIIIVGILVFLFFKTRNQQKPPHRPVPQGVSAARRNGIPQEGYRQGRPMPRSGAVRRPKTRPGERSPAYPRNGAPVQNRHQTMSGQNYKK